MEITTILEMVNEYISGELVLMIPVLMWVGSLLKKSNRVDDTLIPDVLALVGIPFVLVYNCSMKTPTTLHEWVCLIIVSLASAIVLGLTSTGFHQITKQHAKARIDCMFQEDNKEELE